LIKVTLEAMLRFLNWIPLGYIFETPVIDHLITRVRPSSLPSSSSSSY
jgi:exportin-1